MNLSWRAVLMGILAIAAYLTTTKAITTNLFYESLTMIMLTIILCMLMVVVAFWHKRVP